MHRTTVILLSFVTALAVACSNSGSDAVSGVQAAAVAAANAQSSHIVLGSGTVTQGEQATEIALNFTRDERGGLHYDSQSTSQDGSAHIALVAVPPNVWSLENEEWNRFEAADLSAFDGRRMWSLFPFDEAEVVGEEVIDARNTTRYRATVVTQTPISDLLGTLVASDELELAGSFTEVEIDYWIDAEHGWPVKASYRATGDATFEINALLAQVNEPEILVTAPAE